MLRREDVSRFGRRLVEPGFGFGDVMWQALRPGRQPALSSR
jgi:hypothetical protein